MNRMNRVWCVATVLGLSLAALAQEPGRPERGRGRGRGPGGEAGGVRMMAQRLAEQLNLTPEQQRQYDELVARFEAERPTPEQRAQSRELQRQLREARQAGDEAQAQELQKQLWDVAAGRFAAGRQFLAEVEKILTPEQNEKLRAFRDRMPGGPGAGPGGGNLRALLWRLPRELNFSEEQRAQYQEILRTQRENVRPQMEQWRTTREQLVQELESARAAGDEARVTELEAQLEAGRPPVNLDGVFEQLESILTDEQKARLTELRSEFAGAADGGPTDVRAVLRAARRLDLRPEQRDLLRDIQRAAHEAERDASNDPAARAARAENVRSQIIAILDPEQAAEFERLLSASKRDRPDPGGGGRFRGGDEAGPGAGSAAAGLGVRRGGAGAIQRRARAGQ